MGQTHQKPSCLSVYLQTDVFFSVTFSVFLTFEYVASSRFFDVVHTCLIKNNIFYFLFQLTVMYLDFVSVEDCPLEFRTVSETV